MKQMTITKLLYIACVLFVVACIASLFFVPKEQFQAADNIKQSDMLWIKGHTPQRTFLAIFVPSCLSCNDFTQPMQTMKLAKDLKQDYVLVIKGSTLTIDANQFGPSWPNVVSVRAETWDAVHPEGAFGIISMSPDWRVQTRGMTVAGLQKVQSTMGADGKFKL
jgi:hypothetical protein